MKSEETAWQATLDINLRAVLVGAHVATQIMRKQQSKARAKGASAALLGRSPCLLCLSRAAEDAAVPSKRAAHRLRGTLSRGHAEPI